MVSEIGNCWTENTQMHVKKNTKFSALPIVVKWKKVNK